MAGKPPGKSLNKLDEPDPQAGGEAMEQFLLWCIQNKKTIGVLSEEELRKFIIGVSTLTSTEDEVMVYPSYSQGMRPNLDVIYKFIGNK